MFTKGFPADGLAFEKAHCRFFIAFIPIIFCLIYPGRLSAQSEIKISGRVIDKGTGAPIAGAAVTLVGTGRHVITDPLGQFRFVDIPTGEYSIRAERIGYAQEAPLAASLGSAYSISVTIALARVPVYVRGQTVTGSSESSYKVIHSPGKTVIEIPPTGLKSIDELAEKSPEVEIVESGSKKFIRIRGAGLNGTVVMLDGRAINSVLDSRGDISAIPMGTVRRVEINTGGIESRGLAGSVNFITGNYRHNNSTAAMERGSFGRESYSLETGYDFDRGSSLVIDGESGYYRGNFEFVDPRDSTQSRINNYDRTQKIFGALDYSRNRRSFRLSGRFFKRYAGVPGPIFQLTPEAGSASSEYDLYSRYEMDVGDLWLFGLTGGGFSRDARFDSPQTPTNFIPYKTRFEERARDIEIGLDRTGKTDIDASLSIRYESLDGQDLIRPASSFGLHSRTISNFTAGTVYHFSGVIPMVESSAVSLGFRTEWGDQGSYTVPSGSLRANFLLPFDPGIDISYSRGRRLPDLTDLYWKEDVFATPNPELRPERSENAQIGADIKWECAGSTSIRTTRFINRYRDLIIWRRWAGDKFKPVNLSEARIDGWEIVFETRPFSGPVNMSWSASFLRPLNKEAEQSHRDKYLTFRPIESQTAILRFSRGDFDLKLKGRHIGKRYTTEENTKSLAAVDLMDIQMEYGIAVKFLKVSVSLGVSNMGNIQYEILDRQPEKPREYGIRIELSHKGVS